MKDNEISVLDTIFQAIQHCTKKPENFLSIQKNTDRGFKKSTKDLYDLACAKRSLKNTNSQALPELIVENFDEEQIWQQLELENNEELSRVGIENFTKALAGNNWDLPLRTFVLSDNENEENDQSELELSKAEIENEHEISIHSDDLGEGKITKKTPVRKSKKRKNSNEVDDQFFKLEELNRFLKIEDKRESGKREKADSEDEELGSIDLFNDIPDSGDEDGEDDGTGNGQSLKYADFFDSPESDDDDESNTLENNIDMVACIDNDDGSENLDNDNDDTNNLGFAITNNGCLLFGHTESKNENSHQKIQSSLEKKKERLEKRIHQLENQAVSEKLWQLKGEVSSKDRPVNSLLEEFVEFDQVTRPAPVMTEQTTMKLEDIIRSRIKDKAWDDVVKKVKPVETPVEYKKKLIMNQEKSKESLAQIYENEYIKQREALATDDKEEQQLEEPSEHNEIRELMHSLFIKLDALSNFHYTPKPAKPDIKIVSNVPAINMEEVAPLATSDGALLAPEEIQSKQKGDLIGKSERTKTDMKRARRKKKLKQQARASNESKKSVENLKQKKSRDHKIKTLKGRNIINMDDNTTGSKAIKSSTAFFSQLQDQVSNNINSKMSTTAKKDKITLSAIRLKL